MASFISQPLYRSTAYLRSQLGGLTWGPALAIARPAVLSLLSSIEVGTLVLVDESRGGERHVFGQPIPATEPEDNGVTDGPRSHQHHRGNALSVSGTVVELTVKHPAFWTRVILFADMGFAKAYMLGEVVFHEGPAGLTAFFRLFLANRDRLGGGGTTWVSALAGRMARLLRSTNTVDRSLLNTAVHYDISNDMFAAFLSADMTYSCPIWRKVWNGVSELKGVVVEETLEEAQMTKLQRFIDGARIKPTDHVLEFGTGWGSFAIEAVRQTGCRVTTLTLSREQKAWADARISEAGLADRVEVLLMDYRALPVPEKPYDKIVSIEMLEAVGERFLATYFARVDQLLKREGGIAMFQCITMPESRHAAYARREDFINHYIFPGGYLPSITQLLNHITTESRGTLIVEKVENIGGHYARTLRLWRERFLANLDEKIRPALKKENPEMQKDESEVFRRKWEYYFTYCEVGFQNKTLGDVIITVGREGAMELMEGIPL